MYMHSAYADFSELCVMRLFVDLQAYFVGHLIDHDPNRIRNRRKNCSDPHEPMSRAREPEQGAFSAELESERSST